MKKILKKVVLVITVATLMCGLIGCGYDSGSRPDSYDGVNKCKNCGSNSVYDLGFCKSCYEGFMEFTYGN